MGARPRHAEVARGGTCFLGRWRLGLRGPQPGVPLGNTEETTLIIPSRPGICYGLASPPAKGAVGSMEDVGTDMAPFSLNVGSTLAHWVL